MLIISTTKGTSRIAIDLIYRNFDGDTSALVYYWDGKKIYYKSELITYIPLIRTKWYPSPPELEIVSNASLLLSSLILSLDVVLW